MNKCILIGNIATDIETRTTQSGIKNSTFRLAVQRRFKNSNGEHDADFINIVCWRGTAEYMEKYGAKGKKLAVEGSIQTRTYEAQDGSKRYVVEVVADNVEILSPRDKGADEGLKEKAEAVFGTPVEDTDELPFE